MDIQKKFLQFEHLLFRQLEDQFKQLAKEIVPQQIHDFRLSIKKLRAFVEGSQMVLDSPESRLCYKRILKLFDHMGVIREIQINRELYTKYESGLPSSLHTLLDRKEQKANAAFSRYLKEMQLYELKVLNLSCSFYLESSTSALLLQKLHSGIEKNFKILFAHLCKRNWKRQLHPIRIRIRHLWELMQILRMFDDTDILMSFIDHLKTLNRKLGDWHDLEVALFDCPNYWKHIPDQKEVLVKLTDSLETQKQILEADIYQNLLLSGPFKAAYPHLLNTGAH